MPMHYTCINCNCKFPGSEFDHDRQMCKDCLGNHIKSCPFCGAEATLELYDDSYDKNTQRVTCPNEDCPGAHVWEDSKEKAVETWNKRAL